MARSDSRRLDTLLARGRLGGPERDRILEEVLDWVAPAPRWFFLRPPVWVGLASAVGAAAMLVAAPRLRTGEGEAFAPKGNAAAVATLDVGCSDGPLDACPQGSVLVFGAQGAAESGYLGAFAEPLGGGERVFYFSADGEAPPVAAGAEGTRPFSRGIRIGPEHAPGAYRVHLFLTRKPASRDALVRGSASVLARRIVAIKVIAR